MDEEMVGPAAREARRLLARAQAVAAEAALAYAEARRRQDGADPAFGRDSTGVVRTRAGEFAVDELAVMWCDDPWQVRRLLARCARVRSGMPGAWEAHRRGEIDAEQLRVIDRAARRAVEDATRMQIGARVVTLPGRATPQLAAWLLRLVVECEPLSFAARHRRALSERRVTISQDPDGTGWVTGELSASDVAQIDTLLTGLARGLGPADERTEQQRRADLMADLLLGRLQLFDEDAGAGATSEDADPGPTDRREGSVPDADDAVWVEVEDIDLDTGKLLGTRLEPVSAAGDPLDPADLAARTSAGPSRSATGFGAATVRRPRTIRIGVVGPLSSLLGVTDTPASSLTVRATYRPRSSGRPLRTRSGPTGTRCCSPGCSPTTVVGSSTPPSSAASLPPPRRVRRPAGRTCRFPTCTVPTDQCDLDYRNPWPRGQTSGAGLDPGCRRHHRGKTFAWLAPVRDRDAVDWTLPDDQTYRCRDDPLPTGLDVGRRPRGVVGSLA